MNSKNFSVLSLAILAAACSSPLSRTQITKDETNAQVIRDQADQERALRKQALLEREMKAVPEWVIAPPRADSQGFYGVGIGSDADMLTSMRKAKLQGTYELGRAINAELSAEDTMTGSGSGEYRYIVDLFVRKVNVADSELIEQEVKPINGVFKTYVLLKLPHAEFNQALKAQNTTSQKMALEEAYSRLMKRIAATSDTNTPAISKPGATGDSLQTARLKSDGGVEIEKERP